MDVFQKLIQKVHDKNENYYFSIIVVTSNVSIINCYMEFDNDFKKFKGKKRLDVKLCYSIEKSRYKNGELSYGNYIVSAILGPIFEEVGDLNDDVSDTYMVFKVTVFAMIIIAIAIPLILHYIDWLSALANVAFAHIKNAIPNTILLNSEIWFKNAIQVIPVKYLNYMDNNEIYRFSTIGLLSLFATLFMYWLIMKIYVLFMRLFRFISIIMLLGLVYYTILEWNKMLL